MNTGSVNNNGRDRNDYHEQSPRLGLVSVRVNPRAVGLASASVALEGLLPRSARRTEEPDGAGVVHYVLSKQPEPTARFTIPRGLDAALVVEVRPEVEAPADVSRDGPVHAARAILVSAARVAAGLLIAQAWPINKTARQAVAEALATITAEWDWTEVEVVTFVNAIAQAAGDGHTYTNVVKAAFRRFGRGYTTKSAGTLRRHLAKPAFDAVIDWLSYEPPATGTSASTADDAQASHDGSAGATTGAAPIPPSRAPVAKPALADRQHILDDFANELPALGLVGEVTNAKLLFLALVSRRLPRPLGVVVKGASSAGKNHLTGTVLRFFPPSAFYTLTAASERALIYTRESFRHRVIVLYEGEALGDGFFAYVIRSLLSEGRLIYETTVKTDGGYTTQRIEKEGPTGLITTTTAPRVHEENETRMFSLHVDESTTQTAGVMGAYAKRASGASSVAEPDFAAWHALAAWLDEGETRIVIPWAPTLAELIPPIAVRLRRDFPSLVSLIEAHALLHRATRTLDDAGRIRATVEDYEAVYELAHAVFSRAASAAVAAGVREVVEAVKRGASSVVAIARACGIDRTTAWRRVQHAVEDGFLENIEDRPHRPALLFMAAEPPAETSTLLPTPTVLQEQLRCCAVAGGVGAPANVGRLLAILTDLAWRRLALAGGPTVGPGEATWRAWLRTAGPQEIDAALAAAKAAREDTQ